MRLLTVEVLKLRRAYTLPLTVLFAVSGPVMWALALRGVATLQEEGFGVGSGLGAWLERVAAASDPLTPALFLLASGVAATYVFGREYSEGTIENLLTTPVRRAGFLVGKLEVLALWLFALALMAASADVLTRVMLGLADIGRGVSPSVFGDYMVLALVAYLGLPLVGWVAMHWRGYVGALTLVIAASLVAGLAAGWAFAPYVPLLSPAAVWHGGSVALALPVAAVVFAFGLVLCLLQLRYADQV